MNWDDVLEKALRYILAAILLYYMVLGAAWLTLAMWGEYVAN